MQQASCIVMANLVDATGKLQTKLDHDDQDSDGCGIVEYGVGGADQKWIHRQACC
jgi:hypothetical protein